MSFSEEDVAAVCGYMNSGMADTNLYVVQRLRQMKTASAAELVGITESHARFSVTVGGKSSEVSIPWEIRVGDRADMKTALFGLLDAAQRME